MSEQPPALERGIFGYRRTAVNQLISDRDIMLRQAEGRVRASEAKVARLEAELAAMKESNARLSEQAERLTADLERVRQALATDPAAELTSRFVNEELATILRAAEESAARIVERASSVTQRQLEDSDRMWREAQDQVATFAAWRDQVDPILQGAAATIEQVRGRIGDVPEQIRRALAPLADAIASLDGELSDVSATTRLPLPVSVTSPTIDLDAAPTPDTIDLDGPDDASVPGESASGGGEVGEGGPDRGGFEAQDSSGTADAGPAATVDGSEAPDARPSGDADAQEDGRAGGRRRRRSGVDLTVLQESPAGGDPV
jgi:hypothetical protein